ncbi:MAG: Asp-tRNA(Asn)/Glu-tRNA(Gln) amidotransferase subunit GatC [Bacilli bacterium]|nr:Asp-tRNA(Asn)/Glu-tRNA(Gln) amidotransferase subunit GatC [Bacilli bacterium]
MGKFTSEMVDDYADKLLIGLTKEENQMVLEEFEVIDKTIDIINEIPDIEKVEPMTHTLDDFEYELREDVPEESIPLDELLENCDDSTSDGEVVVPRVVG